MTNIEKFQELIDNSNNIVFFGGAGVSTASGIPDFRSTNGLFHQKINNEFTTEYMLSNTFYRRHKDLFFEFYKTEMCITDVEPCITHKKLAKLEQAGKLKAIITQNIDGLHQKAGSKKVIELHGTIHKNYCTHCGKEFSAEYVKNSKGIPVCDVCNNKEAIVKPWVTLYEEELHEGVFEEAESYVRNADLLIVAGTSLNVYPAASLLDYFSHERDENGKRNIVLLNRGDTGKHPAAKIVFNGDMNNVFKQIKIKE